MVPDEPSESDEESATVSVHHVTLGVQTRLGMGDTSFFFRYDLYSIFCLFFDIDTNIDIFIARTMTTKYYF